MSAPAPRLRRREEALSRGPVSEPAWSWPIDLTHHDRTPALSPAEVEALTPLGQSVRWWCQSRQQGSAWRALDRLVSPLAAVRATWSTPSPHQRYRADMPAPARDRR